MPKIVDHDARRAAIAEALWRLVERDGMEAVTMRAVAREAGWSTGVVAHYFADMDALTTHSFAQVQRTMADRAARAHARAATPRAGVRAALAQALPLDRARRREASVWFGHLERARHSRAVGAVARTHYRTWRTALSAQTTAAWPHLADPDDVADELIALVDGIAVRALAMPRALPRAVQLRMLDRALARIDTAADLHRGHTGTKMGHGRR